MLKERRESPKARKTVNFDHIFKQYNDTLNLMNSVSENLEHQFKTNSHYSFTKAA